MRRNMAALSTVTGQIRVEWRVSHAALIIVWEESQGPKVDGKPATNGFGSQLVRRSIAGQLRGTVDYAWRPEGLLLQFTIPVETSRLLDCSLSHLHMGGGGGSAGVVPSSHLRRRAIYRSGSGGDGRGRRRYSRWPSCNPCRGHGAFGRVADRWGPSLTSTSWTETALQLQSYCYPGAYPSFFRPDWSCPQTSHGDGPDCPFSRNQPPPSSL